MRVLLVVGTVDIVAGKLLTTGSGDALNDGLSPQETSFVLLCGLDEVPRPNVRSCDGLVTVLLSWTGVPSSVIWFASDAVCSACLT